MLGSSKASGLFSKAKAWPAASPWQGTNRLGRHFPKAQLIPGSRSDFVPLFRSLRVTQLQTPRISGGGSQRWGGGRRLPGHPTWCLSFPGQKIPCPEWLLQRFSRRQAQGGGGMSLPSPLCTKPVGGSHLWRPVTLGQWEGKAGSHLETKDTRILHWADLTQYWGVLGTVWGAAWVPCPKGVG